LSFVFDLPRDSPEPFRVFFGLVGSGRLWVDDVTLAPVAESQAALTPAPVWGEEEAPIEPPGKLEGRILICQDCRYRSPGGETRCYACGRPFEERRKRWATPDVVVIADFEAGREPFGAGELTGENAPQGRQALLLRRGYAGIDARLDFSEHDFLRADVWNGSADGVTVGLEIRDTQTKGYWTRVNRSTMAPPGLSTISFPTIVRVGEFGRPGRLLLRDQVTRLVFSVGDNGPIVVDNVRLERLNTDEVLFPELIALDFGPASTPVLAGFRNCGGQSYTGGRGMGWREAKLWGRVYHHNAMQPDSLVQDFMCPESGSFLIDLPNGEYRVHLTVDAPGHYWGEVPVYRERAVVVNGETVLSESMDFHRFEAWYYRNQDTEDLPGDDPFDKYVAATVPVREYEATVTDSRLEIGFKGRAWAVSLSSLVVYPAAREAEGARFMAWVRKLRRREFADRFKQAAPRRRGATPPAEGWRVFHRDPMLDVGPGDGPEEGEAVGADGLHLAIARGEEAPLTFSVQAGAPLGSIRVSVSGLADAAGRKLPADVTRPGWIDYRFARMTMDGSVYTIAPRYWRPLPAPRADGITRRFWFRVRLPGDAAAGTYRGQVRIAPEHAPARSVPVTLTVLGFALAPITDVAVGPWGGKIDLPWFADDPLTAEHNSAMLRRALAAIRAAGCTSLSHPLGLRVTLKDGQVRLDAATADREMALMREVGFEHLISAYGVRRLGYDLYKGVTDVEAARHGFPDAATLLRTLYQAVDRHAVERNWLPVAWNLCDEPVDAALESAAVSAAQHRAAGEGLQRTRFMGCTSMRGAKADDSHGRLVAALPMPTLNLHDAAALDAIKKAGNPFAFYNGGSRWTYGRYMKMLVNKHGMALRLTWHFNVVAGNPYYALDCREDDYCWYNGTVGGALRPNLRFLQQMQPGLNDYRYLTTLETLLEQRRDHANRAVAAAVWAEMVNLTPGKDRTPPDPARQCREDRGKVIRAIGLLLE